MNKIAIRYLKKMCEFAGVDYNLVNFDDDWNGGYTWTREQRYNFIMWMSEDLKSHKGIRKRIMDNPDKKNIPQFVTSFVAAYGFKTEDDE